MLILVMANLSAISTQQLPHMLVERLTEFDRHVGEQDKECDVHEDTKRCQALHCNYCTALETHSLFNAWFFNILLCVHSSHLSKV